MHILIVGWYGTETVGDKAILGGIITEYQQRYPNAHFTIASIFPLITKRTMSELGLDARIIPTHSFQFVRLCAAADHVVMGGGPLMDLEALSIPLWAFIIARFFRRKRIVYGCGLGPLNQTRYVKAVTRILALADEVRLRDSNSIKLARTLVNRSDYVLSGDPSQIYLRLTQQQIKLESKREIALFIRSWPPEYAAHLTATEYAQTKNSFEQNFAQFLIELNKRFGPDYEIVLYPMHCFVVGDDDRIYARYFVSKYLQGINARIDERPSSVQSIVQAMLNARFCVCMRFHSVVFAQTLQRDFLAIDYTAGGKIYGFLKDNDQLDRYVRLEDIAHRSDILDQTLRVVNS